MSPSDRLALALALAAGDRWAEAREVLRPLTTDDEGQVILAEALRARAASIEPLTAELLGPQMMLLRAPAWALSALQHNREPFGRRALLDAFVNLHTWPPDGDFNVALLLLARAGLLRELGDLRLAHTDLDAARATANTLDPGERQTRTMLSGIDAEEARVLAAEGDLEGARTALQSALGRALDPTLARARFGRDPALAAVARGL